MSDSIFRRRMGRRSLMKKGLMAIAATMVLGASPVTAQTVLFRDDFNGGLDPLWRASLPTYVHANTQRDQIFGPFFTNWAGAPPLKFDTLGGVSVLRMNQKMAPLTHSGLSTATIYKPISFRYEVRFNTLTQGPFSTDPAVNHSIDGFLEIGLFDPTDAARYDVTSLFGNRFHLERTFQANSGIDGFGNGWHHPMNPDGTTDDGIQDGGVLSDYRDNTWYKLVLTGGVGQNIAAQLETDTGQIVSSWTFSHDVSAYPNGFRIALAQYMGIPPEPFSVDIAVDYAQLLGVSAQPTRPSLGSLSPASVPAGSSGFSLTVNGSGFLQGAVVKWQGQTLNTTYVSATQLTATIPVNLLTTRKTVNITVTNPGNVSSVNAKPFVVTGAGVNIRISSGVVTANSFGDKLLQIEVTNFGSQPVSGIVFDPANQLFKDPNGNLIIAAFSVEVLALPERDHLPWTGNLAPQQSARLFVKFRTNQGSGTVALSGKSAQGDFSLGTVGVNFP